MRYADEAREARFEAARFIFSDRVRLGGLVERLICARERMLRVINLAVGYEFPHGFYRRLIRVFLDRVADLAPQGLPERLFC